MSNDAVKKFREGFAGEVLEPSDPGYDEARSIWNGDIVRRPAVIARCANAENVVNAIRFARAQDFEVSVRGGGHNFAGHALSDGGLTIDLSVMRHVSVDSGASTVRCGGGATWADLDGASQAFGLAVPGGVISHTGVAGLTLGGGIGWLSRKAGLSCDNLLSATVVTADGRIVTASADENPDLHWALRGGGGNFGVVTEFEFTAHHVGPIVHLSLFFWPVAQGLEALRVCRDAELSLPDGMGMQFVGLNAPPAPFVREMHHFTPGYALLVVGWEGAEAHAAAIAPIRDALTPLFEMVTPIPYAQLQQMIDESAPWGILGYEKAITLDDLTDSALSVIADHFPRKSSPMSVMPLFPLGGAFHRVGDDDTAFGGSRAAKYVVNIAALAPAPELLGADRAWARSFWDALRPHASTSGSYINFLADADDDRVRAAYGDKKYARLQGVKREFDPDNVFHLNANIRP